MCTPAFSASEVHAWRPLQLFCSKAETVGGHPISRLCLPLGYHKARPKALQLGVVLREGQKARVVRPWQLKTDTAMPEAAMTGSMSTLWQQPAL